jgi:peptidoglycan hydrolase CwlO-like protein
MNPQSEPNREEVVYRIDPFSIIFRELDLLHSEISFLHKRIDETNKRIDEMNIRIDETNKRIDELARDINRRLDKLFLVVIINLVAIIGFLLKIVLDRLIK